MPFFRKKPCVIEAHQFTYETRDQVFNWITCASAPQVDENGKPMILLRTLEGDMQVRLGDWVIRGVKGEFYACKPDIFEATYEAVPEPDAFQR